jgi:hypothetical protein
MAKAKKKETSTSSNFLRKRMIKRKGRNAKKKNSQTKTSKNYKKPYVGQGR